MDWKAEDTSQSRYTGPKSRKKLGEVMVVGEETTEDASVHDLIWVGTQHIVPARESSTVYISLGRMTGGRHCRQDTSWNELPATSTDLRSYVGSWA
jgi:hypothetical protein